MGKFVPEADFEMKYFQNELAQRPVNRFQRPWTFFLAKNMPQTECAHSQTLHMIGFSEACPIYLWFVTQGGNFCTDARRAPAAWECSSRL